MEYFKCDDERIYELLGEIIKYALTDYMEEIPPIQKGMTSSQRATIKTKKHNRATATMFFKKSNLFKLCQLDFEYLQDAYKRGVIKNKEFTEHYVRTPKRRVCKGE